MRLRHVDGQIDDDRPWPETGADVFEPSVPWRTFRWRHGQKHYSGTYWSSTMRDHVIYESRLELTRLLYADFDPDVTAVYAQPFLLSTTVDDRLRRHVPDFLVLRDKDVPLVVDVKPRHLLARPKVNFALEWAREAVLSAAGTSRCGVSRRKRSWRTCASSPATAATGSSARTC